MSLSWLNMTFYKKWKTFKQNQNISSFKIGKEKQGHSCQYYATDTFEKWIDQIDFQSKLNNLGVSSDRMFHRKLALVSSVLVILLILVTDICDKSYMGW